MASANFRKHALALAQSFYGSGTFKALLLTSLPSEGNLDAWEDRAEVTGEHAATGGYTTGGFDVTVDSITLDTDNNRAVVTFTADSPTYTDVTLAGVVGCLIYKSTGVAANDPVLHVVDYGSAKGVTAGNFTASFTTPLYINA